MIFNCLTQIISFMDRNIVKSFFYFFIFVSIAMYSAGCRERQANRDRVSVDQVNEAANNPDAESVTFTLPVLDALFFEEGFESDVQTELKLTKDQVEQLKSVSGTYVAALTEDGNNFGSAREANQSALEQIKKIIGDEKTKSLLQLVARRYESGDVAGLLPTKPNAVPTDTRIIVNAPAFRMDAYEDGKLVKTYRIGIGYPEFPLPTGMRAVQSIIFNPTWTPPNEAWVKGKFQPGRKVAAGSKLNPLGVIKIPIGMPSLIHGGKAAVKLGDFASHGCVGLTDRQVQDFTIILGQLSGTPLDIDSVKGFEKNKTKTKIVKLSRLIPVELRYETIVAENGNLVIYRDVYERGTNTRAEAARILEVYGIKYESLPELEKAGINAALHEMNLDSGGKPIANIAESETSNSNSSQDSSTTRKEQRAKKGKVTRSVTGTKEIKVPISSLKQKGYPEPLNLDNGEAGSNGG